MKVSALRYLWAQIWIKELTQDLDHRAELQKDLEAQLIALRTKDQGQPCGGGSTTVAVGASSGARASAAKSQQLALVPPTNTTARVVVVENLKHGRP